MKKFNLKTMTASLLLAASSMSFAADIDMNADANDLAIKGYDPVAYFTMGKPVNGDINYTATYKGAIYRFSSESNRDMFRADPAKFAPQYGGYCAYGVTRDKKFDTDPTAWRIIDNKLYLNLNKSVQKAWLENTQAFINQSDESWLVIKDKTVDEL
ncbi:YHS domain-containing protein [Thalassotalea euphylliae]|uniref:YHS domain-containing protein n=1 Tax=Thalassotalea euphylliae TaxID=1655234 RepID=A0A3E0TPN7_9GAMM|nr:YHS domain-containing (seleno)protein [Thalassotalea euphylliae]REL26403.1 YHS domain-containing protein [Thalassotalea euphylliae]